MHRYIGILGATGSIGQQALEIIAMHPERFKVGFLTAHKNAELLIQQALQFQPEKVVLTDKKAYETVKETLSAHAIEVLFGEEGLRKAIASSKIDLILVALVGFAGVLPTLYAIQQKKAIALANKEVLVVAGALVKEYLQHYQVPLLPVDSEHSAIYQCLVGEDKATVEKLVLTASGGPFRTFSKEALKKVTVQQALQHPNWQMGAKITVDSATLMNKALEVIEAYWLFDIPAHRIEVVIHPQSIVHSLVYFCDGSIKAQLGLPDMRVPIQYALGMAVRLPNQLPRYVFNGALTFEPPDLERFPSLNYAYEALERGGNYPCILNAANEIAVERFLKEEITFLDIYRLIEYCLNHVPYEQQCDIETLQQTDKETRIIAKQWKT